MKRNVMFRFLGIITLVIIIWFVFTACESGTDSGTDNKCSSHKWSGDVITMPTCTEGGFTTQTCINCHATQIINQTSPQHKWNAWNVITAPNCTATGLGTRNCSICSSLDPNGVIPALEHDWEWMTTLDPTCTVAGSETRTCSRNSAHKETRSINALRHDWSGSWSTNGNVYTTCRRNACTEALDKYEMAAIPNGNLIWGSAVIILSAFNMGKYEVWQELYYAVMGTNPSSFSSNPASGEIQNKRPVEQVTWYDAVEFCNKLSEKEGLTPVYTITGRTPSTGYPITRATVTPNWEANGYRLPTEAQWEYACRAGTTTNWNFGNGGFGIYVWFDLNSSSKTHQVGLQLANAYGLYDMHGNVWEWCWDWYGTLPATNQNNYTGAVSGTNRVARGGGWISSSVSTHSAYRSGINPYNRNSDIGFRVVRPVDDNTPSHTHTYSTTYSSNATQHWQECTGAGCDAKIGTANHAPANGICTTCRYVNMEMVSISAGTFQMGTDLGTFQGTSVYDAERPVRQVTLSAFKMGKYEVTQEQYQAVMGTNPSKFTSNPADGEIQNKRPVEQVTWYDAVEFCNKLSTKEGLMPVYTITSATVTPNWEANGYRLPTEAQWEYACRAGTMTNWYFGSTESQLVNYAWYTSNSNSRTHQVGLKQANSWGLYDMHGNVYEWCWDRYSSSYYGESGNTNNPMGPASGTYRVLRGGGWYYSAEGTRSANRNFSNSVIRLDNIGFRVVRP